ncbi:hypothetical protein WR25_16180 isoform A [Diploscapter pachys]|uniref:Uncharacterized protein n=1 Tax=Diploscapter pachys TaxID=2018661 RepID=A0A2A2KTZ9_9BILA|nr:hypothetical protein WR25_16180 isoform A [Diploscapter pachys]
MSQFGDSESEESTKESHFNEDKFGSDVSLFERKREGAVRIVVFKLVLGVLFVGFATGCIVYAVITSENSQTDANGNELNMFPVNLTQMCMNGTYTIVIRIPAGGTAQDYNVTKYGVSWVQDAEKQRVYHRVGLDEGSLQYEYHVYQNFSYYRNTSGCQKLDNLGYAAFIHGFGIQYIEEKHEEQVKIGGKYHEVIVYEGEPPLSVTTADGIHPALIRGYSSADRKVDYGWSLYFANPLNRTNTSSIFQQEYWFPTMIVGEADWAYFDKPDVCP